MILRLHQIALPLASNLDITDLFKITSLPFLKKRTGNLPAQAQDPYNVVANVLLIRLSDLLVVCGTTNTHKAPESGSGSWKAVWINKKAGEIVDGTLIRHLFETSHADLCPSNVTVAEIEGELNRTGRVQLYVETSEVAQEKSQRLTALGFNVTLTPVVSSLFNITIFNLPLHNLQCCLES
jgi:hypothetical protein